jgi:lipopolysaccharide transport system permease protein
LGLFAVGVGWVVASLHVFLRDTAQVVAVILTFWLWLTPIFIPEQNFPPAARFVLAVNPLSYVVRAYRSMLLGMGAPDPLECCIFLASGAVAFIVGGLFFRHMKRGFADVL